MSNPHWRRVLRLHRPDPRADVEDEFAFHLEERTEAFMAQGMAASAARELALRQFGDLAGATATCTRIGSRRVRRIAWRERWESVVHDFAYAVRTMRRTPGFAAAAVATIALGIGANTVVFSLLNALLVQPLDAVRPGELVRVYTSQGHAARSERDRFGASSYADYVDLRQSPALAGLLAFMPLGANIEVGATSRRFEARVVSDNYFTVLGRPLHRGGWRAGSADAGALEVIVSYRFWKTALEGDPTAIGRPLVVNARRVTIAGITSPAFRGIEPTTVDLYVPFRSAPELVGRPDLLRDRSQRSVRVLGRLAHGMAPRTAEQALDDIMHALGAAFPATNARRTISVRRATSIVPLELNGDAILPTAGLVFAATLVMLGITGVNVAAVLLARTMRRRRELAVRTSLGASALRLVRQLVTESVVLALAAGVVVAALMALLPVLADRLGVPASVQPRTDLTVLAYAAAVAASFGLLFGLAPALIGTRADVLESLRSGDAGFRPTKARAQRILVCSQLALSMLLLLVGSGLVVSLDRQQRVDPGFTARQLVVADFEDPTGTINREREQAFRQLALERLRAIPGVTSVAMTSMAPLASDGVRSTLHIPGYAEGANEDMGVRMVLTTPDFFRTLRIPVVRGRELAWDTHDTLSRVVVNQSMARRYWGTRDPVGTFVELGGKGGRAAEVIGVVADSRFLLLSEAPQPLYAVQAITGGGKTTVLVRTSGDAAALLLAVRGVLSRNDVPLTLVELRTMEEVVQRSLRTTRAVSDILMAIGVVAVLLAAVGLYGVVSYVMAGRTREFGVRLALGATPVSITRLVLGYGLRLAVIGGVAGMLLGFTALRLMSSMLFGSWMSVPGVAVVGVVLGAVALVACGVPAARAMAISPATAMRSE